MLPSNVGRKMFRIILSQVMLSFVFCDMFGLFLRTSTQVGTPNREDLKHYIATYIITFDW